MSEITPPRYDLIERNDAEMKRNTDVVEQGIRHLGRTRHGIERLRDTDAGTTHWIGDDGYAGCWREHRICAEQRVARLEAALCGAIEYIDGRVSECRLMGHGDDGEWPCKDCCENFGHHTLLRIAEPLRAVLTRVGK